MTHRQCLADAVAFESGTGGRSQARVLGGAAVASDAAIDPVGALHVAYLRMQHWAKEPAGLYYRRSENGGESWSVDQIRSSDHRQVYLPADCGREHDNRSPRQERG